MYENKESLVLASVPYYVGFHLNHHALKGRNDKETVPYANMVSKFR
ncbi:hypothetical protein [Alteribacter populi]|nr:hypothetical protein [Alteribacter populi]